MEAVAAVSATLWSQSTPDQNDRARALLLRWLTSEQAEQYTGSGYFDVIGCDSGKRYRIKHEAWYGVQELDDAGSLVQKYCFVPTPEKPMAWLPVCDTMLAQKIALEHFETAAMAIANRFGAYGTAPFC
jgi:hypothetical protein